MTTSETIVTASVLAGVEPGQRVTVERFEGDGWYPVTTGEVARRIKSRGTWTTYGRGGGKVAQDEWTADGYSFGCPNNRAPSIGNERVRPMLADDAAEIGRRWERRKIDEAARSLKSGEASLAEMRAKVTEWEREVLRREAALDDARAAYVAKGGKASP